MTDPDFRRSLGEDPAAVLRRYELGGADLELLASQRDEQAGAAHRVEQRTSKSAVFGLLAGSGGVAEGAVVGATPNTMHQRSLGRRYG